MREPCFANLLKVLRGEEPNRSTLFEFFLHERLYRKLAGPEVCAMRDDMAWPRVLVHAFWNAGYDYVTLHGSEFAFPRGEISKRETVSIDEGGVISDYSSFREYPWPDPDQFDYSRLERIGNDLPEGMRVVVWGPGGVLENAIGLVGYENLCFMIADDPDMAQRVFDAVGLRLVRYYQICSSYDTVGALISNDDWGFKTQTMLSVEDMRRYVFTWHRRIVEVIHESRKPAILHSCGNLSLVMDDVIDYMQYDGKHSYEDAIEPVEDAYERWGSRIAILGGIDLDFVCRSTPEQIRERSRCMLERVRGRGGYALGTGNSVPSYVPDENYFAMISAVD